MQQALTVVFTAKEILEQVHRELVRLGADTVNIPLQEWKQYVLARAIEDVFLLDLTPGYDCRLDMVASIVRSNYRRIEGDQIFTIQQDVGTNKLYQFLRSSDLPFKSRLELHKHRVTLGPRHAS